MLIKPYAHDEIEAKWRARWRQDAVYRWRNDASLPKRYVLEMFPYTSGRMHIGHARNYTMGDVLARLSRARGFDVLYPMGWDAFGLPAENAALTRGIHPRRFTRDAIESMKEGMERLSLSYDWDCEIDTSSADYIRAQQILFLRFRERGLIHRGTSFVSWCDRCSTVLANEQAAGGKCWRCATEVVKRRVPQWFMNIRAYADELLDGLDGLHGWPDSVKNIQRAWIGRSDGAEILFDVEGEPASLRVFTTRADTAFGCTFLALAPEHDLLDRLAMPADRAQQVATFRAALLRQTVEERFRGATEKSGAFTGCYARNPLNGERVPIWVADYVLIDYGTGAIMAVPAHDERDLEFARRYELAVRTVIVPVRADGTQAPEAVFVEDGRLVASGPFEGMESAPAREAIGRWLKEREQGGPTRQYRLQNWSLSRQRYWGNPIPIIHCETCGPQPVPEKDLPLLLPENVDFDQPGSPLVRCESYMSVACPRCGHPARRDPDTMDTFVDSSWYFLRYPTPRLAMPFDTAIVDRLLPADVYIGGVEHATLHLMYSRFFIKVLRDLGMLHFDEPFVRLYNHGMVNDAVGKKQSKSLGNVVEPFVVIEKYGADALRLYLMFTTSYDAPINWDDEGPKDARAYLNRVWRLMDRLEEPLRQHRALLPDSRLCTEEPARSLLATVHRTIEKVGRDIEHFQFNTAIAALMTLTNEISVYPEDAHSQPVAAAYRALVRMLGLFAPVVCEEIWSRIADDGLLVRQPWPVFDPEAIVSSTKEIAVQVNGKFILSIVVPQEAGDDRILETALNVPRVADRLSGKVIRKTIHVPNRLVNIVAS